MIWACYMYGWFQGLKMMSWYGLTWNMNEDWL